MSGPPVRRMWCSSRMAAGRVAGAAAAAARLASRMAAAPGTAWNAAYVASVGDAMPASAGSARATHGATAVASPNSVTPPAVGAVVCTVANAASHSAAVRSSHTSRDGDGGDAPAAAPDCGRGVRSAQVRRAGAGGADGRAAAASCAPTASASRLRTAGGVRMPSRPNGMHHACDGVGNGGSGEVGAGDRRDGGSSASRRAASQGRPRAA